MPIRRDLCGALLVLCALLAAAPCLAQGVLLRVDGAGGRGWLFGSLHVGSSDLYPLGEPVERAFAASDRIMVEVNLLDLAGDAVAAELASRGRFPEKDGLRRHISEDLWQRLFRAARALEFPLSDLERQRPWLAALTLAARLLEHHGLLASQGVDQHFMRRARRAGVPILELETFASQMRLFDDIPVDEQVLMLQDTLTQVETGQSLPMELVAAWRVGDHATLERILLGGMSGPERGRALARRLLAARNAPMADRVAGELGRGGTVFVVVGTAHLLGSESLAEELRRRGLHVAAP